MGNTETKMESHGTVCSELSMGNRDDDIRYSASNWKNVNFLASYLDGGQCVVVIDSLISSALFVKQ